MHAKLRFAGLGAVGDGDCVVEILSVLRIYCGAKPPCEVLALRFDLD